MGTDIVSCLGNAEINEVMAKYDKINRAKKLISNGHFLKFSPHKKSVSIKKVNKIAFGANLNKPLSECENPVCGKLNHNLP